MDRNFTSVTKLYDMNNNVEAYVIVENGKTSYVPLDEANTDYQAIQEWIADGGTVIDNGGSE
jgi:predicted P-loop ATPase/GTPase